MLTRLSIQGDNIEKMKHDTRVVLYDNDTTTIEVCHAKGLRHLEDGALPLNLDNSKDFLHFCAAISRGRLGYERTTVDSVNPFTRWFFAGFAQVTGNLIMKKKQTSSIRCKHVPN